ncbi:hypothetical protein, partial [Streptomyces sp. NPDC094468]|uniref:hypothetical protein n=1 Tax=Streptomyces sp. NPDC094468 TaxID=3366066 RepID=UPI0037FED6F8
RQHRPIDHDRHTRIMPLARNDASPTITHQLVNHADSVGVFVGGAGWGALQQELAQVLTIRLMPIAKIS